MVLNPEIKRAVAERLRFYNELGIYDFYRQETANAESELEEVASSQPELPELMTARSNAAIAVPSAEEDLFAVANPKPESKATNPVEALRIIREDLGDCTRCVLHKQGRKQIVFGVGNPKAELMFIGE